MTILAERPTEDPQPGGFDPKLIQLVLILGLAIGTGAAKVILPTSGQLERPTNTVTRADYERVQPGMSQVEVEAILNPGIEVKRSKEEVRLLWQNPDGSKMEAEFENKVLVNKEQSGLK